MYYSAPTTPITANKSMRVASVLTRSSCTSQGVVDARFWRFTSAEEHAELPSECP